MTPMKKSLLRFLSGATVAAAATLALSPAHAAMEPELKCAETEVRVVCCVIDGTEVSDCKVFPK